MTGLIHDDSDFFGGILSVRSRKERRSEPWRVVDTCYDDVPGLPLQNVSDFRSRVKFPSRVPLSMTLHPALLRALPVPGSLACVDYSVYTP